VKDVVDDDDNEQLAEHGALLQWCRAECHPTCQRIVNCFHCISSSGKEFVVYPAEKNVGAPSCQ